MKAYRIHNNIVAAIDAQAAIAAWAGYYRLPFNAAGPVEEVDPATLEIAIEEEEGEFRAGTLAEVMPVDGPAQIVAFGECEDCG